MQKGGPKRKLRKPQKQRRPGFEYKMSPQPLHEFKSDPGCNKLAGKKVLITGGDSGIGRAVAILFAKNGADIAISYLRETKDANITAAEVQKYGRHCYLFKGDIGIEQNCKRLVTLAVKKLGGLDVLVNNAAEQFEQKSIEDISVSQLIKTFSTNIFSMIWITKEALKYLKEGSCIINTSSVTAYRGSPALIDYSSTKGAIVSFTRSLSANLIKKGIRVNGVAPGPIWTPLIPSSFKGKKTAQHGSDSPMQRAGQPAEVAYSYLFLASKDSSYMSGQFLHPNGGEIVNG